MPPKKNKTPCNAFYFFMLHVQQTRGGKKLSLAEASRVAGPLWEKMSAAERAPFQKVANEEKARQKEYGEKYTSQGRTYSEVEQENYLKQQKQEFMKNSINSCIQMAVNNDTLKQQTFYFIDINIFCVTSKKYYVPAELAVSKFNFEQGVYDTYHAIIDPEFIPTGYTFEAKANADETHQLPLPPDSVGDATSGVVLGKLVEFLFNDAGGDSFPPLYTIPKNMEIVEEVLKQFCEEQGADINFHVFNLADLFMYLMNASTTDIFDTSTVAELQLEKDVYDFYTGLACEYHETTDVIQMCSLSKVKRWGFIIADYCCHHLGIDLIPGFHVPVQADVTRSNPASRCASRAESVRSTSTIKTLPRPISPCSSIGTPAPSVRSSNYNGAVNSFQNENINPNAGGAMRRTAFRPPSPTDSLVSATSKLTLDSTDDFPPLSASSVRSEPRVEQIRRPKTQSQVATVATAASLLGYSTTDASGDEGAWSTAARNRPHPKGRGRGIAAKFSNA